MWAGETGEIRCEIRLGRAEKPGHWKGGYWGAKFTPRGTTYVYKRSRGPPLRPTLHDCDWVAGGYKKRELKVRSRRRPTSPLETAAYIHVTYYLTPGVVRHSRRRTVLRVFHVDL